MRSASEGAYGRHARLKSRIRDWDLRQRRILQRKRAEDEEAGQQKKQKETGKGETERENRKREYGKSHTPAGVKNIICL